MCRAAYKCRTGSHGLRVYATASCAGICDAIGAIAAAWNPGNTPCCMIHFTKNVQADLTVFLHKKIYQPTLDTTSTFAIELKECQEKYTTMVKIAVVGGTGSMQPGPPQTPHLILNPSQTSQQTSSMPQSALENTKLQSSLALKPLQIPFQASPTKRSTTTTCPASRMHLKASTPVSPS